MGKQARDRRLADHEAGAQGRNLRTSPQKLNLVAQSIQGKDVEAALASTSVRADEAPVLSRCFLSTLRRSRSRRRSVHQSRKKRVARA